MDEMIVNFAVYEDAKDYMGIADVTLPDIEWMSETLSGAGISGQIESTVVGQLAAMTMSMTFRTMTKDTLGLCAPKRHQIDLRAARQDEDPVTGTYKVTPIKHVMVVLPKKYSVGKLAAASTGDGSGDFAVRYWATYIDGKKVMELDPLNNKCEINGRDYLKDVNRSLGKY